MLDHYDAKIKGRKVNRSRPPTAHASRMSVFYPATPPRTGDAASQRSPAPAVTESVVLKKLAPTAAGARRLAARFGDALVCVRYREDAKGTHRLTTVELIVDMRPLPPGELLVRIAYDETDLRARVKDAGGTWDGKLKLWRVSRTTVRKLKLTSRVVAGPA